MNRNVSSNEFNLSKAQMATENKAQCKVVINTGSGVQYPTNPYTTERDITVETNPPTDEDEKVEPSQEFYRYLSVMLSLILRGNNPKMIANIIDQSGKIIVGAQDLVNLIARITNRDPLSVSIVYDSDEEQGCFVKVNPVKRVRNIKIGNVDFQLRFNKEYNILSDEFHISLSKVIIE